MNNFITKTNLLGYTFEGALIGNTALVVSPVRKSYNELKDKPSIEGVELQGDHRLVAFHVDPIDEDEATSTVQEAFSDVLD